ncbi:hypothetical protein FDP41_004547 [Naegleria fowleri]|uniref:Uncharacterized protein n=1 Tax=Naegleria fowleri TaxID=5763 RepID=A0A6A5BR07_NAEFO|nr:uncharacterized protein FDP41_004592 [Naegleria fowleri]XP_044561361.1 uncharacterized protein FDP41_004547 [Naegleria fowleri]KAF0976365.1 hypothetical protein FDP41_004592 [Naegleria fowleri]KAF0976648.1 hypothetical protein FDP41_004547 [Naegleria fowleri]
MSSSSVRTFLSSRTAARAQAIVNHIMPVILENIRKDNNILPSEASYDISEQQLQSIFPPHNYQEEELFTPQKKLISHAFSKYEFDLFLKTLMDAINNGKIDASNLIVMDLCGKVHDMNNNILIFALPKLSFLKEINLSNVKLNDDIIVEICTKIPQIERLKLENTSITDNGCIGLMKSLPRPQNIKHLNLSKTRVTENSFKYLADLFSTLESHLEKLEIACIDISQLTVTRLLKSCRKLCKIEKGDEGLFVIFRNDVILQVPSNPNQRSYSLQLYHPLLDEKILRNILSIYRNVNDLHLKSERLSNHNVSNSIRFSNIKTLQSFTLNDQPFKVNFD